MTAKQASDVWQAMRTIVLTNERRDHACQAVGLTITQLRALYQVTTQPASQRDLAAALHSEATYITLVIDELETRGYVKRHTDPGDRRRKLVTITDAGLEAASTAKAIMGTPPQSIASLPDAAIATLQTILVPLATKIDAETGTVPVWR
jgi:DNA-binding MarR family transcriptional regulator